MKIKILFIALISLFASISANAQTSGGTSNLCIPKDASENCFPLDFKRIIALPQFPDCKFEVQGLLMICNGELLISIQSFEIPDEGCQELLEKLKYDDQGFHTEFKKWFEKQMFYTTALQVYDEIRSNVPSNENLYCPNGVVMFTGYFGQCIAYAQYQMKELVCPWRTFYKFLKLDCNGYPCCELQVNICMDKETGAVKVTEVSTPIASECEYSEPYNVPVDRVWGPPIWVGKCSPACSDKYPYNAPAPTK